MWQYPQTEICAKGSGKEVKIQEFRYRDTTNVEPEMYDYTSNIWSQWNSKEKLKEKFGRYIDTDIFVNCSCVDTRWQHYSTHLHTNNTQNNTINLGRVRADPSLRVTPWHLP